MSTYLTEDGEIKGGLAKSVTIVIKDGILRTINIMSEIMQEGDIREKSETYQRVGEGKFRYTTLSPTGEEERIVHSSNLNAGFRKDLLGLNGQDYDAIRKLEANGVKIERWYRTGVNFETNSPIYLNFQTGEIEGFSRDKETERKKRDTRKLLRTASGSFKAVE